MIHKWADDITIGFGNPHGDSVSDEHLTLMKSSVESLLPQLEKATGLNVKIINPDQEHFKDKYFGRIRIMPVGAVGDSTFTHSFEGPTIPSETRLWGAELFDPVHPLEMRGFLLPKANNELGLVICKIYYDLEPSKFKERVEECLLRSMGLPGRLESASSEGGLSKERMLKAISIVYCPNIESGMSKNKVLHTLSHDNQCKI